MRQILAKPRPALTHFRTELNKALGQNARVLSQLVPELERLLGPQPPVPELEPKASESRFHMVAQEFVQVFARPEHPLVLFLDDLQWSDLASLSVLEKLLTDPDRAHLLIIGAYREAHPGNEVDAEHPVMRAQENIAKAGGTVSRIELTQLSPGNVLQLLTDALNTTAAAAFPLSAELHRKTLGNPFFLGRLLVALVQDGLIHWDRERGAWAWDLPAITRRPATDNAGALLADRLQRLPPQTLELLKLGACIGRDFDHATLCLLAGQRIDECAQGLSSALREGFIVPLADDYRLLREVDDRDEPGPAHSDGSGAPPKSGSAAGALELAARVSYRFQHDRVQEAAYQLVGEDQRRRTHRLIARHLRMRQPLPLSGTQLFTLVDHLNISLPLLTDASERREAVDLNVQAGLAAKVATAHETARRYFETAVELLGEEGFTTDFATCFLAHRERAQATFRSGELARADALFEALGPLPARRDLVRGQRRLVGPRLAAPAPSVARARRVGSIGVRLCRLRAHHAASVRTRRSDPPHDPDRDGAVRALPERRRRDPAASADRQRGHRGELARRGKRSLPPQPGAEHPIWRCQPARLGHDVRGLCPPGSRG